MRVAQPTRITATGTVYAGPGYVMGLLLTAGADAASATLRAGGPTGTVVLTIKAAAGSSVSFAPAAAAAVPDLHVTLTGTSPELTVLL